MTGKAEQRKDITPDSIITSQNKTPNGSSPVTKLFQSPRHGTPIPKEAKKRNKTRIPVNQKQEVSEDSQQLPQGIQPAKCQLRNGSDNNKKKKGARINWSDNLNYNHSGILKCEFFIEFEKGKTTKQLFDSQLSYFLHFIRKQACHGNSNFIILPKDVDNKPLQYIRDKSHFPEHQLDYEWDYFYFDNTFAFSPMQQQNPKRMI